MLSSSPDRSVADTAPVTAAGDTVRLLVTIDTECDKGAGWAVRQPLAFSNILRGIPHRLQPLFGAHDVTPTYLLSPEVLADPDCAALFRSLAGKVDLGTHLHAEFIEPHGDPDTTSTSAVQCDLSPDVEARKLENLTRLFESRIGFAPVAFRAGRFGISPQTLPILESLGYRIDSSITPNRWTWFKRGHGVNFLGAPLQPYHPDANDFRRPGRLRILEVPVTILHPVWDRLPRALTRAIDPLSRPQTVLLNYLGLSGSRCRWLRPTYSDADAMVAVVEDAARLSNSASPVVCMMFHSNEATAGTSPYFDSDEAVDRFLGELDRFFTILRRRMSVRSVGLSALDSR